MRKEEKILSFMPVVVFYITTGINLYFLLKGQTLESFFKANELAGSSILMAVILYVIARNSRMYYNYISVIGLLAMNMFNLVCMYLPIGEFAYKELILLGAMVPFTLVVIILQAKKI